MHTWKLDASYNDGHDAHAACESQLGENFVNLKKLERLQVATQERFEWKGF
jgi:hypothetical protein